MRAASRATAELRAGSSRAVSATASMAVSNPQSGSSQLVRVPGGLQHIEVRAGQQLLGALDPTLSLAHVNSLVIAEGVPQWLGSVTPDTGQAAPSRANLRMINVVGPNGDPPNLLDVLVKAPNPNPDSVMTFGLDSRVASYGTLMYFDPGAFQFRYVPDGGGATLAEVSFSVAAGEKKAVVLERNANGSYRATVVLEP